MTLSAKPGPSVSCVYPFPRRGPAATLHACAVSADEKFTCILTTRFGSFHRRGLVVIIIIVYPSTCVRFHRLHLPRTRRKDKERLLCPPPCRLCSRGKRSEDALSSVTSFAFTTPAPYGHEHPITAGSSALVLENTPASPVRIQWWKIPDDTGGDLSSSS